MSRLRHVVGRYEVWIFLVLIVVVNGAFVGGIGAGVLPSELYSFGRFALLGGVLIAVVLLGSGVNGVLDLFRPMLNWRIKPGWYLLALAWPVAVSLFVLLVLGLVRGTGLDGIRAEFGVISRPAMIVVVLVGAFVGEIVWVGYAIRKLSPRFTPFLASQIVGTFWTLWWMPMVILNVGVIPDLPPVPLLINMLGVAAMCAFVYYHTRSGIAVLMLQVMVNSSAVVLPVMPTSGGIDTYWVFAIFYLGCTTALFLAFGPRPLLPGREGTPRLAGTA